MKCWEASKNSELFFFICSAIVFLCKGKELCCKLFTALDSMRNIISLFIYQPHQELYLQSCWSKPSYRLKEWASSLDIQYCAHIHTTNLLTAFCGKGGTPEVWRSMRVGLAITSWTEEFTRHLRYTTFHIYILKQNIKGNTKKSYPKLMCVKCIRPLWTLAWLIMLGQYLPIFSGTKDCSLVTRPGKYKLVCRQDYAWLP